MSRNRDRLSAADAVAHQAAQWLARRDRGLSPVEQDEYLQWLRQDPRHGAALARHEATLRRLMRLGDWQPALSDGPNPDLFAPRTKRFSRFLPSGLAAAAAVAAGLFLWPTESLDVPQVAQKSYLRVNERQALPDGSIVELKDGSRMAVVFSDSERRVRLTGGEAHFTVASNPARPFIVESGDIEVRAVGTAFNVRLESNAVEVVVTHGTVALGKKGGPGIASTWDSSIPTPSPDLRSSAVESGLVASDLDSPVAEPQSSLPPQLLNAGQRAIVALAVDLPAVRVTEVTPEELRDTLAWQTPRLQFYETPLAVAVAEFNRHAAGGSSVRIVLADPELGAVRIGGTFRVDNVEGFVRTVEVTLDLRAEPQDETVIMLTRAR